jgi:hypothetical protein
MHVPGLESGAHPGEDCPKQTEYPATPSHESENGLLPIAVNDIPTTP